MSSATYRVRVIVLRKTKLGESDLILTLLAHDGSQIRAVAKGARKPSSPFSSRLELYSIADVLIAGGRNLDIIKEAKLDFGNEHIRCEMEYATCAASMAELLDRVTQLDLEMPRLFDMTASALTHLDGAVVEKAPALAAAHLLKTLALAGFRPSLTTCIACGAPVLLTPDSTVFFSYQGGGVVCQDCRVHAEAVRLDPNVCAWADFLLSSTFDQVENSAIDLPASFSVLQFCQSLIREHIGVNLKSLQFMFTCGL